MKRRAGPGVMSRYGRARHAQPPRAHPGRAARRGHDHLPLPGLLSARGAGPRYRTAVRRQLAAGWLIALGVVGWMALGLYGLTAGPRWFPFYRDLTLVLMGAGFALLPVAIRAGNRRLATLQTADAHG